jgi:WD repeat-containing protein 23
MRDESRCQIRAPTFDYRFGDTHLTATQRKIFSGQLLHPDDCSINTYRGAHKVFQTLVRCYFSPISTGQRFIITGSYDGCAAIYDVLTGQPVTRLTPGPSADGLWGVVRDVSWHPYQPRIFTTSWDRNIREWTAAPFE